MIERFCQQFQEIYAQRYMITNIHQLLQLCDNVKSLGPLWTNSCFSFKDKNRFMLQLIHGSQKVEFQLNSAISIVQTIPNVVEEILSKDSLLHLFYQSMNQRKCLPVTQATTLNTYLLGKATQISLSQDLFALLSEYLYCSPLSQEVYAFKRMLYLDEIFHATTYQRVTRRDSTVICYTLNDKISYGCMQMFIL